MSRGALRCLALLQSYAAKSGRAFPFQKTLAAQLEVDVRTVKRYVHELCAAGELKVRRRQHSSAEYEFQKGQNVPSNVPSGVPSGRRFLSEKRMSTVSIVWPKDKNRIPEPNREATAILDWAKANGYQVETGGDLLRVMDAMEAETPRMPPGKEETYRPAVYTDIADVQGDNGSDLHLEPLMRAAGQKGG
jgi:hypothetical protein